VTATAAAGGAGDDISGSIDGVLREHIVTVVFTIAPIDQVMVHPDACHVRTVGGTSGMRRRWRGRSYANRSRKSHDRNEIAELDTQI
jgi:hypothetical protein